MNNELRALSIRLWKNKSFFIILIISFAIPLFISLTKSSGTANAGGIFEQIFYYITPYASFLFSIFVSLFLGVEHSDGTLRNKLIAGYSRHSFFLSAYLISAFGCICITASSFIGSLPGLIWFKGFGLGLSTNLLMIAVHICSALVFAAIFTIISLLISNKTAVISVVSIVLWIVLFFVVIFMTIALNNPLLSTGEVNPLYAQGTTRVILDTISHFFPGYPVINLSVDLQHLLLDIIYTLGLTIVLLFAGCIGFRKKMLK